MRAPLESRLLLATASRLVPPALREDWLREWQAEVWWWRNGQPNARSLAARLRLLAHCRGAFADARCLREDRSASALAWLRTPVASIAALALLLTIVVAASGGLHRTRTAFRAPSPGAERLAILSQTGPFMGWRSGVPAGALHLWSEQSQTIDGIVANPPANGLATALCRLKPGVTPEAAQAELRELIARAGRGTSGAWVTVTPLESVVAGPIRTLIPAWLGVILALAVIAVAGRRRGLRYRAFFAAKAALSLTVLLFAGIEFGGHLFRAAPGDALLGRTSVISDWSGCAKWATSCGGPKRTTCATGYTNCGSTCGAFITGSHTFSMVPSRRWSHTAS